MKICRGCGEEKPLSAFHKHKGHKDGYRATCALCVNEKKRKSYELDFNSAKKATLRSRKFRAINPLYVKQYYQQNREQRLNTRKESYIRRREQELKYNKQYRKKNPEVFAYHAAKRRATLLRKAPNWLTKNQLLEIKKLYESCPKGYHVDHIVPLHGKNVSGLHVPWNLQHLPAEENLKKSNRFSEV